MSRLTRVLAIGATLGLGIIIVGCLAPGDYQLALLVSPNELDFGTEQDTLSFKVAKVFSARPMPPFQATVSADWISVSPTSGVSSGPTDPVQVNVTVDRTKMPNVVNTGFVTISAEDIVPQRVMIRAEVQFRADFTASPQDPFVDDPVQFTDQSQLPDADVIEFEWDFGDGTSPDYRFDQNPEHTYTEPGMYDVTLTVTADGQEFSETKTGFINVRDRVGPVTDLIGEPREVIAPDEVDFQPQDVQPGTAPIDVWEWDFGDGNTAETRLATNLYQAQDEYEVLFDVSLRVVTAHGEYTRLREDYILVWTMGAPGDPNLLSIARLRRPSEQTVEAPVEGAPQARFEVAYPWNASFKWFLAGETVDFVNLSIDGDEPAKFLWDFGDGATAKGQTPTHVYDATGKATEYVARMTATNASGSSNAVGEPITVFAPQPLDAYIAEQEALEARLYATFEGAGYTARYATLGDSDVAPILTIVTPDQPTSNVALLVLSDAAVDAEHESALATAAIESGQPVAVLHLDAAETGYMAAAYTTIAAMDAIEQTAAVPVASFQLAGAAEGGWTAWLATAADQRVQEVTAAAVDMSRLDGMALGAIEDLGVYADRVQVPVILFELTGVVGEAFAAPLTSEVVTQLLQ